MTNSDTVSRGQLTEAAQCVVDWADAYWDLGGDAALDDLIKRIDALKDALGEPSHPHDGYAYDGCFCGCCVNVRVLQSPSITVRRGEYAKAFPDKDTRGTWGE
jgi:hypothetical protein